MESYPVFTQGPKSCVSVCFVNGFVGMKMADICFFMHTMDSHLLLLVNVCTVIANKCVVAALILFNMYLALQVMSPALVFSVLYLWCQINKEVTVRFWFGIQVKVICDSKVGWEIFPLNSLILSLTRPCTFHGCCFSSSGCLEQSELAECFNFVSCYFCCAFLEYHEQDFWECGIVDHKISYCSLR